MTPVQARTPIPAASAPPVRQRPLRVLMGIPAAGATGGGPALHLPMLVHDLRQREDVEVVTMPYGRWNEGEPLLLKIWHQLLDLCRYPARLRAADPDLVHLNTCLDRRALVRDTSFVLLTRLLGRRTFLKWHGSEMHLLQRGALPWRLLGTVLLRAIDALGVLSSAEAEEIRRLRPAIRCFVVKNCLEPGRYAERVDLRAELGLPATTPLLLFISRLIPGKGLEDVIAALPDAVGRYGAHLLVVGDGPCRGTAKVQVRALGLQDAVHFLGALPEADALRFYNGADILVFPSRLTEGFPMVLFQSVAAGLGIVTTRLRAAVEYLHEPANCFFVEPQAPGAIAAALGRLLGEPRLLARMQADNRVLARRFERRTVAAEFEQMYGAIVKDTRQTGAPANGRTQA